MDSQPASSEELRAAAAAAGVMKTDGRRRSADEK